MWVPSRGFLPLPSQRLHRPNRRAVLPAYADTVVMPMPGCWDWQAGVPGLAVSA
jgi:hypothetical protein